MSHDSGASANANAVAVRLVVPAASHPQSGTTVPHHPPAGQLPFTGAPVDALLTAALALIVAGGAVLNVVRRKGTSR